MNKRGKIALISVLVIVLLVVGVESILALDYYVNQNHPSASDSNPGTESLPWETIGRAAWGSTSRSSPNSGAALQAGDTVYISNGIYISSLDTGINRWDVLYNSENSGIQTSPITFIAEGVVEIQAPSWGGPVIGSNGRNYIHWMGPFYIDEANILTVPDTGSVVLVGSTGSGIDGVEIDGDGYPGWNDNHNGIRIEGCINCFVRNTIIHDVYASGVNGANGAGVMLYGNVDAIIENNEIYNTGSGVFVKGFNSGTSGGFPNNRTIVRFNEIHDVTLAIPLGVSANTWVYQNLIRDCGVGVRFWQLTEHTFPISNSIINNIFHNISDVFALRGLLPENNQVWNNIITNSNSHVIWSEGSVSYDSNVDFQHNNYFNFPVNNFAELSYTSYSFANWLSTFNQDQLSPSSITTDPQYVNEATNDFSLQAGSPARTLGVDILDLDNDGSTTDIINLGVYVTEDEVIGPLGITQSSEPECNDNLDNDGDGDVDLADTGCVDANDDDETDCGDGVISGSEICDGTNLGIEDCMIQGFTGGNLTCNSDCLNFDISSCMGASPGNCTDIDGDGYNQSASGCGVVDCDDTIYSIDNDCSSSCSNPHPADTNPNCCGVDSTELNTYINRWFRGEAGVTIELVAQAIDAGDNC